MLPTLPLKSVSIQQVPIKQKYEAWYWNIIFNFYILYVVYLRAFTLIKLQPFDLLEIPRVVHFSHGAKVSNKSSLWLGGKVFAELSWKP